MANKHYYNPCIVDYIKIRNKPYIKDRKSKSNHKQYNDFPDNYIFSENVDMGLVKSGNEKAY